MIISLKWICDFVDISEYLKKPQALADVLTRAGLEVENITNKAKDFEDVVVGHILSKDKHPNADKLSLCQVTTGQGVVHQIVCGAQNHKAGDNVVVALPGAVLPGNFAIKKAMVRGVESGGMLCSKKELGLETESEGIWILPSDAPVGTALASYQGFDDVTFELKVTPNRSDCLSHYGLAREISCLLGLPLKKVNSTLKLSENSTKSEIQLEVKRADLCPRYAGRYFIGVKVGESPEWLKKRLESVGQKPINNIVDITNYVMLELGQPLHAFDAELVSGKKIIVDTAKSGEKFQTLDGTEWTLFGDELMIRDQHKAVAMAGVIGGKNSGVSDKTANVFLEAAYFMPMSVRKSSRMHGVNTDSGYRFSRGVDPDQTIKAMDRASELIQSLAGAIVYTDHHDFYPQPVKKNSIKIDIATVSQRLGYEASAEKFNDFMIRLGCQVEKSTDGQFQVLPPSFRFDLDQDMDLVEEYARLYGYEHIPESLPATKVEPSAHDSRYLLQQKISQSLIGQGFRQALNLAFVGEKDEKLFLQNFSCLQAAGLVVSEKPIRLMNPLSDDQNVMRSSLVYGLMKNMVYNFHQGNEFGRLFEAGSTFSRTENEAYLEHDRIGFICWGMSESLWLKDMKFPLVFELKSAMEAMFEGLHVHCDWLRFEDRGRMPQFLHRGQAALLKINDQAIGFAGALHPSMMLDHKIRVPVALAEIDLQALKKVAGKWGQFHSISKQPTVVRDLALLMSKTTSAREVISEIQKAGGPLLRQTEIFDYFEGNKLEKGQKSVAFRLKFQDKNATLQDESVNKIMSEILTRLKEKFQISPR